MKILFVTRMAEPHVGGVEKHVSEVSTALQKKGHKIIILTEKYDKCLKNTEIIDGTKIVRFSYPHIKLVGILVVWWNILNQRKLIMGADIVHIHDVFIWYLPFRFIYPRKKVITTFHGLEWDNPLSRISIFQKKIASKLSSATVGVGIFLEKYLGIKFNLVIYGAASSNNLNFKKEKDSFVYVGRLERNTGLLKFLKWIDSQKSKVFKVDFVGDGELRNKCKKYGIVYGFSDPIPFYKKSEYSVPGGYLAALEALSYKCKLKLFWNNKVKDDYWNMSPFIEKDVGAWAKSQTWEKLANEYINLYNSL
jgi:glycosyltransferase involved in cell wall biosynthesis